MATILVLIYMGAGYWATGHTIYRNKILIGTSNSIFGKKLAIGTLFGWALIPAAFIMNRK